MSIPSFVYIVVGAAIAVFSRFVDSRTENAGIILFFYVGLGFVIWGVFKVLTNFVLKDRVIKDVSSLKQKKPDFKYDVKKSIVSCRVCQTKHYSSSNFCHMCGTKLLK